MPDTAHTDDRSFRDELQRRLGDATPIESFPWSGDNTSAARRKAARGIAWWCRRTLVDEGCAGAVLIGHSHGGNIINSAAALLPDGLRARVRLVQVSTPFIVETPRYFRLLGSPGRSARLLGLTPREMLAATLMLSFPFFFGVLPLLWLAFDWNPFELTAENYARPYALWSPPPPEFPLLRIELGLDPGSEFWDAFRLRVGRVLAWRNLACLAAGATAFLLVLLMMAHVDDSQQRFQRISRRQATKHVDRLLIYHSSDEAILGLGLVSFVISMMQIGIVRVLALSWRVLLWTRVGPAVLLASFAAIVVGGALLALAFVAMRYVVLPLALILFLLSFIPLFDAADGAADLALWIVDSWVGQAFAAILKFSILAVAAAMPLLVAVSGAVVAGIVGITLLGLLRYGILRGVGIYGASLGVATIARLVFGEVVVLPAPLNRSLVHVVPGLRFFNHTAVFDERAVRDIIGTYAERFVAACAAAEDRSG